MLELFYNTAGSAMERYDSSKTIFLSKEGIPLDQPKKTFQVVITRAG
jgi:hypothetical protein